MKQMQLSWRPGAYTAKANPTQGDKGHLDSKRNRTEHLVQSFKPDTLTTIDGSDSTISDSHQGLKSQGNSDLHHSKAVVQVSAETSVDDAADHGRIIYSHSKDLAQNSTSGAYSRTRHRKQLRHQHQTAGVRDGRGLDVIFGRGQRSAPLFKGNSDPFKTFSIDIDPQVNRIISFFRDSVLPSLYSTSEKDWLTSASARKDFQDNIGALSDEGSAYGFLARYAEVAAALDPSLQSLAVAYRYKSLVLLRKKTQSGVLAPTPPNLWHIFLLYAGELQARNYEATVAHAKMLLNLFDQQIQAGQLDYNLLFYVLHNDHQMSCIFLTPPVFDVNEWVPGVLRPLWAMAEPNLPAVDWTHHPIDSSVNSQELESIIHERRVHAQIWLMNATGEIGESPLILLWIVSKTAICHARLVIHYLEAKKSPPPSLPAQEARDYVEAQQYLALALLHWGRSFGSNTSICGIPFYDASSIVLGRLQSILRLSNKRGIYPSRYDNARLWSLYIGAVAEHSIARNKKVHAWNAWFNTEFVQQARRMDLLKWESIRKVLDGFLYSEHYSPDGSTWVERALER